MKFSNESKKKFSDNHRQNYASYNKSSIFEPIKIDYSNEINKALIKTRTLSSFVPIVKEETPFNRKMKEFWNKDEYVKKYGASSSSKGFIQKETKIESNNIENNNNVEKLNAKDRKFLDLNPEHKIEENKNYQTISFFEKNSFSPRELFSSAKEKRTNDMNSNIFYDPEKTEEVVIQRNKSLKKLKTVEHEESKENKSSFRGGKNTYRKTPSTIFNDLPTKGIIQQNFNATQQKHRNLNSVFFDPEDKNKFIQAKTELKQNSESKESVKKVLQEKTSTLDKANKLVNLASSFQDKNYYSQNYLIKERQDREVEDYEIVMKNGYEKFEPKEVKYCFFRKGIHIYDFQEKGKYYDGNNNEKVTFKIRKNDDSSYNSKMQEINEQIEKMGMKMVPATVISKKKAMYDYTFLINKKRSVNNASKILNGKAKEKKKTIDPSE